MSYFLLLLSFGHKFIASCLLSVRVKLSENVVNLLFTAVNNQCQIMCVCGNAKDLFFLLEANKFVRNCYKIQALP